MKRTGFVVSLGVIALVFASSPVFACPWCHAGSFPLKTTQASSEWGSYPTQPYTSISPEGRSGGGCGFYSNSNYDFMGMVSTEGIVRHILFPSLASNSPISQLYDWASRPDRIEYFDVNGQVDFYFIMTYDTSGSLDKVELFDATNALAAYTECEYDPSGQLVKTLNYDEAGGELSFTGFSYNAAGQLVKIQTYVNGLTAHTLRCIYNRMGQISRVSRFDHAGALQMYTDNTYNAKRQLIRTVSHSSGGTVLETRTYAYNAAGQLQRVSDYNNRGASNGYVSFTRDTNGQPTNRYFYDASNTMLNNGLKRPR